MKLVVRYMVKFDRFYDLAIFYGSRSLIYFFLYSNSFCILQFIYKNIFIHFLYRCIIRKFLQLSCTVILLEIQQYRLLGILIGYIILIKYQKSVSKLFANQWKQTWKITYRKLPSCQFNLRIHANYCCCFVLGSKQY